MDHARPLVAGERPQRLSARERLVHDEVERLCLTVQPCPAIVAGEREAPRPRVLALEAVEAKRLAGDVDDLLVNLYDAYAHGR